VSRCRRAAHAISRRAVDRVLVFARPPPVKAHVALVRSLRRQEDSVKKRLLSFSVLAMLVFAGTIPVQASSLPVIRGEVSGLELCPQSICGAAIFTGLFVGQVGLNPFSIGVISVGATHEDLPDPGYTAEITGGVWSLRLLNGRRFTGLVTAGSLFNNGNDTFAVDVQMQIFSGGSGQLRFDGTLSHQVFPPTLIGGITQ
jgi:hypothetical protein